MSIPWNAENEAGDPALGQFGTPDAIANLLVSRLAKRVKTVLDLGVGLGSLSSALIKRFPNALVTGIDIKPVSTELMSQYVNLENLSIVKRDITAQRFAQRMRLTYAPFDAGLCNPPFSFTPAKSHLNKRLRDEGFALSESQNKIRLDLLFAASAFNLIKRNGELGLILPVSTFAASAKAHVLQNMMLAMGLKEIIRLPSMVFRQAEVDAAILMFQKGRCSQNALDIFSADADGKTKHDGRYSHSESIHFLTNSGRKVQTNNLNSRSLSDLAVTVKRGTYTHADLKRSKESFFHTTSFGNLHVSRLHFDANDESVTTQAVYAEAGDILIPRVGTRCLDKSAIVLHGRRIISDCVLQLRVPENLRRGVWEFISSDAGINWRRNLSTGTCAKFIPQGKLLSSPLPKVFRP